jgi:hypothetical protein
MRLTVSALHSLLLITNTIGKKSTSQALTIASLSLIEHTLICPHLFKLTASHQQCSRQEIN